VSQRIEALNFKETLNEQGESSEPADFHAGAISRIEAKMLFDMLPHQSG
jgi:hypothetical protein